MTYFIRDGIAFRHDNVRIGPSIGLLFDDISSVVLEHGAPKDVAPVWRRWLSTRGDLSGAMKLIFVEVPAADPEIGVPWVNRMIQYSGIVSNEFHRYIRQHKA